MSSHMHAQSTVQAAAAAAAAVSVHALVCVCVCVCTAATRLNPKPYTTPHACTHTLRRAVPLSARVVAEQDGTHLSLRRRRRRRRRHVAGCSSNSSLRPACSAPPPTAQTDRPYRPHLVAVGQPLVPSDVLRLFALLLATVWLWLWRW